MINLKKLTFILVLLYLCLGVNAIEYYANTTFEIQSDGSTIISGTTNYSPLSQRTTQELTSKTGKNWTFLLSTPQFSEYSYKIILPSDIQIQKIETNSEYFFGTQNGKLIIEGYGENMDLNLKINYTIVATNPPLQLGFILVWVIFALIIIGILITLIKKYKNKLFLKKVTLTNENTFDKDSLTERQLLIIEQLEKKNGKNTQSEIQKILGLPKASLFRNITSLEKKGILKKERKGMTMLLTLEKHQRKQ